jgi:hypothetical protein
MAGTAMATAAMMVASRDQRDRAGTRRQATAAASSAKAMLESMGTFWNTERSCTTPGRP